MTKSKRNKITVFMKLIAPHLLNEQQIQGQLYKDFLLMELDLGEAETRVEHIAPIDFCSTPRKTLVAFTS